MGSDARWTGYKSSEGRVLLVFVKKALKLFFALWTVGLRRSGGALCQSSCRRWRSPHDPIQSSWSSQLFSDGSRPSMNWEGLLAWISHGTNTCSLGGTATCSRFTIFTLSVLAVLHILDFTFTFSLAFVDETKPDCYFAVCTQDG